MPIAADAESPRTFRNAFGFLRLLFASMVIASHVPELADGNNHRELLYRLTGTVTFGSVAVWGFFVVSGYLIAGSFLNSSSYRSYFIKRIARIYPAFIVASAVCLVIVAPLSGAALPNGIGHQIVSGVFHMAILARPTAAHPFAGQHISDYASGLNAPMWTIQYEFACYLLIALIGALRGLKGPVLLALAAALLTVATWMPFGALGWMSHYQLFSAPPEALFQLTSVFFVGAAWYCYKDRIAISRTRMILAAIGLALSLQNDHTVLAGFCLFGSYLIFAVARLGANTILERINQPTDISYGVYLYAWPIEQLLIRYVGSSSLLALALGTWLLSVAAGYLSWRFVEAPALELAKTLRGRSGVSSTPGDDAVRRR